MPDAYTRRRNPRDPLPPSPATRDPLPPAPRIADPMAGFFGSYAEGLAEHMARMASKNSLSYNRGCQPKA